MAGWLLVAGGLLWQTAPLAEATRVYRGAHGELRVETPRLERAEVRIDGALDEPAWAQAAVLADFTQFAPVEGAPASERTEVRIFYTPEALYVGVRAFARDPSQVRARLAQRDRIDGDDRVEIWLDTYHDRRRAYVFAVNPLGVQADGIYSEAGGGLREDRLDTSPDFLFDSKGRRTPDGYVVELRIPLKSLKFPRQSPQAWGIQVVRRIAATGAEETWAPLSRSNPRRLEQAGELQGLRDLKPGRLVEVTPAVVAKREGSLQQDRFRRGAATADAGVTAKVGLTSDLTLDATINPDFSQVEADADQITVNERFAISFPEKRPFFLEGSDLLATFEPLVYTRRMVAPQWGVKVSGKQGPWAVAYLGVRDAAPARGLVSTNAPDPRPALFQVLRLRRDVGGSSTAGVLATARVLGAERNVVVALDGRLQRGVYSGTFLIAGSADRAWEVRSGAADTARQSGRPVALAEARGHLLHMAADRSGRHWGWRLQLRDVPDDFRARVGFLRRTDVTELNLFHRLSWYGRAGALVEDANVFLFGNRIYPGRSFWRGGPAEEGQLRLSLDLGLRRNRSIELRVGRSFFRLDPEDYDGYGLVTASGDTVPAAPYLALDQRGLWGAELELRSEAWHTLSANVSLQWQGTPIFAEGSEGREWSGGAGVVWRPTEQLRAEGTLRFAELRRARDGSRYSRAWIPRAKIEYQWSRALALRLIGQYTVEEVDLVRGPDGQPLLWNGAPVRLRRGQRLPADAPQTHPLRIDALFSYQPSPGTVVYLGYGREMVDEAAFRFAPLRPRSDGLFLKVSYLWRW